MLRVERAGATLTLVSRLARPRALAVLAAALLGAAALARARAPGVAAALAALAVVAVVLGGRATRARFDRAARVTVTGDLPFRAVTRPLGEFVGARVETVGEARHRRAERIARSYRSRSGRPMPGWLRAPPAPGVNDHLRRVVLVPRAGEPVPVTAWLPSEDDVEAARGEVEALLG